MIIRHEDQRDVTIDAPEEGKIGPQRRDILIVGVIHLYPEAVGTGVNETAYVKDKCRIASLMVSCMFAVDIEVDLLVGAFESYENQLAGKVIINPDRPLIPSNSSEVSRFIIHSTAAPASMMPSAIQNPAISAHPPPRRTVS